MIGLLAIGTSCLALVCVIGRSRVPAPPASMRPFIWDRMLGEPCITVGLWPRDTSASTTATSARPRRSPSGSTRMTFVGSRSARFARRRWSCGAATAPRHRQRSSRTCTTSSRGLSLSISSSSTTSTTTCGTFPTTTTHTPVRKAGSSGTGSSAKVGVEPKRVRDDDFPMRQWGLPTPGELDRVVVVSPHLDDAVLSCARFMAAHPGCTVATVFAGNPPSYPDPMRLWDEQSGFGPGDDVMAARRAEDEAALAVLAAEPRHLDFVEHTYLPDDRPVAPAVIEPALTETLRELRPTLVLAPFGLANPDHDVTHKACMLARDALGEATQWWCYEDTGYKHIPGMLAWRVARLFRRDVWPTPVSPP